MSKFEIGEIIGKISPASAEVMEFRRDNNAHGFLSNLIYSTVLETNEMGEIQNLGNKLTDMYVNHSCKQHGYWRQSQVQCRQGRS